ncbi:hypothetical protein J7K50_01230, partial [bacterium]|nr:hypothetical protein [bacterium]
MLSRVMAFDRAFRLAFIPFVLLAFILVFSAACKGGASGANVTESLLAEIGNHPSQDAGGIEPITRTLGQVIAEIEEYEPPGDAGVDPDVFAMIRDELVRQIEARTAQTRERRFLGASGNPTAFSSFAPWKGRSLEIDIDTVSSDRLTSSA